jgi:TrmH family RNA methyltransferase
LESDLGKKLWERANQKKIPLLEATEKTMAMLSETCQSQGVIACAKMPCPICEDFFFQSRRFLILMDIADPGNLGTLLRTAEAFGWDRVVEVGNSVDIYNPKVIRSSMGAVFRLKILQLSCEKILKCLEQHQIPYFVTMPSSGVFLDAKKIPEKLALFLGNEAHGLPLELCKNAYANIQIPMKNNVESLNVSSAGAVLMFLLQTS